MGSAQRGGQPARDAPGLGPGRVARDVEHDDRLGSLRGGCEPKNRPSSAARLTLRRAGRGALGGRSAESARRRDLDLVPANQELLDPDVEGRGALQGRLGADERCSERRHVARRECHAAAQD